LLSLNGTRRCHRRIRSLANNSVQVVSSQQIYFNKVIALKFLITLKRVWSACLAVTCISASEQILIAFCGYYIFGFLLPEFENKGQMKSSDAKTSKCHLKFSS